MKKRNLHFFKCVDYINSAIIADMESVVKKTAGEILWQRGFLLISVREAITAWLQKELRK